MTSVVLDGLTFDYDSDFIGPDGYGWTRPYRTDTSGNVLFKLLNAFLDEVVNSKAGIASVSGVAPSSAGNVLLSDGTNWVRSHSSGVTALLDALSVSGAVLHGTGNSVVAAPGTAAGGTKIDFYSGAPDTYRVGLGPSGDIWWQAARHRFYSTDATPVLGMEIVGGAVVIAAGLTISANGITVNGGTSSFQDAMFAGAATLATWPTPGLKNPTGFILANNATTSLTLTHGLIYITERASNGEAALVFVFGGSGTAIIAQTSTHYSTASGTASKINIYYSAGSVVIENKLGTSATLGITVVQHA